MPGILVCGSGDVGSAVAHCLFQSGYDVVIHELTQPTTTRRKMAFADAVFDGSATLEGVESKKVNQLSALSVMVNEHKIIPLVTEELIKALQALQPHILVDARMRKHSQPESQIHLAILTIGLGPNFVAGETTHLVTGILRGLTHTNVPVPPKTKVIEIDPGLENAQVSGIAERPAHIAQGVLQAVQVLG